MRKLFQHINKFVSIDEEDFKEIVTFFELKNYKKKEGVYGAGMGVPKHYFVLSGCAHLYFINDRGAEQTLQFAIEDWWITDYLAFQKNQASEFYIQAVENLELLQISREKQEELLEAFPRMEVYFRQVYQVGYGAAIMRMKYIFTYSKEEIYFRFRDAFPEFVNSVPQYLVATYLGLSPEYVSKLRRKQLS